MTRIACAVCLTAEDLPAGALLARHLKQVHPGWELHAVLVEPLAEGGGAGLLRDFDHVTEAETYDLLPTRERLFGLGALSIAARLRPLMLEVLLAEGAEMAVVLSPDMLPLAPLDDALRQPGPVLLAPRFLRPARSPAGQRAREALMAEAGLANPGFIAARAGDDAGAFIGWWGRRMAWEADAAELDSPALANRLLDQAPALFGATYLRHAGLLVGPATLSERPVALDARGDFRIGEVPLLCLDGAGTPAEAAVNPLGDELVAWHRAAIAALTPASPLAWRYRYGRFADGTPVPAGLRRLWRARADLRAAFSDPSAVGPVGFRDWALQEHPALMENSL